MPPRSGLMIIAERSLILRVRGVSAVSNARSQAFATSMLKRHAGGAADRRLDYLSSRVPTSASHKPYPRKGLGLASRRRATMRDDSPEERASGSPSTLRARVGQEPGDDFLEHLRIDGACARSGNLAHVLVFDGPSHLRAKLVPEALVYAPGVVWVVLGAQVGGEHEALDEPTLVLGPHDQ